MKKSLLSVIIPAYNEESNIVITLTKLHKVLHTNNIPHEIIVANDSSTDGTEEQIRSYIENDKCVKIINCRLPRGFGRAIRTGIEKSKGDFIIIYMADCSDSPDDLLAYYQKLEEGYDCVFGSRFTKGSHIQGYPYTKLIINRIVNKCIQTFFWCPYNDLTNAFKAYRKEVIHESGPYRASHFNITIEMSLGALIRNYNIIQIPISWKGRTSGVSKLKMWEMGRRYLSTLLKVMAEKILISDDIIADRLSLSNYERDNMFSISNRIETLENRLDALEVKQAGSQK